MKPSAVKKAMFAAGPAEADKIINKNLLAQDRHLMKDMYSKLVGKILYRNCCVCAWVMRRNE